MGRPKTLDYVAERADADPKLRSVHAMLILMGDEARAARQVAPRSCECERPLSSDVGGCARCGREQAVIA